MHQTAIAALPQPRTFVPGGAAENPKDSDYALAREAAGGAIAAIGELYERYGRRVYALCLRMTRDKVEAEDLTQDIFILLFRKIGTFRGESRFITWLHRLTVNHVLMHYRRATIRREKTAEEDFEAEFLRASKSNHAFSAQVVERIAIDAALAQLPPGCRMIFILFDVEGYKHEEIARMLGCSTGNSKSQLHKARLKLRQMLKT
ncbi:MAG: RNA polymerase sigma factor [Acidobacteria bacterium]|nr:RNA polymerase sigma factor [Acidobacteriota bacterium]